jgi:hypothetical protein
MRRGKAAKQRTLETTTALTLSCAEGVVIFVKRVLWSNYVLTLFLLLTASVAKAQFAYITNGSAIAITGYFGGSNVVIIPSTISGMPVTSIGEIAFYNRLDVSTVTIPNSVISVGAKAFLGCGLTSIVIPDSVLELGDESFSSCPMLTNAVIGRGVTSLGSYTFGLCPNLTSVLIPNGVTNVGSASFNSCTSLTSIVIPQSVTTIGNSAFGDCNSLTTFVIPNQVVSIGDQVFRSCRNLTNITIGQNLASIGRLAFYGCTNLNTLEIDTLNPYFNVIDGVLFNESLTSLVLYPPKKVEESYAILNSVIRIEDGSFCFSHGLTNLILGTNVTIIGDYAFQSCINIQKFTMLDSVAIIGFYAFNNCSNLTSVVIGTGVTSIGGYAFDSCMDLERIVVPESVVYIGYYAFASCLSLKGVYFQGDLTTMNIGVGLLNNDVNATVYYLPGTGFYGSSFLGRPAVIWRPEIQPHQPSFDVQTRQFGFSIIWSKGMVMLVEACTNLNNPTWISLKTNLLDADSMEFNDSESINYPIRFYRIRSH